MARKRRRASAGVSPAPAFAGPHRDFPQQAFGVHRGRLVQVPTPAWGSAQAFWDVWAATAELVTLSQHNPLPPERVRQQIGQLVQTQPDAKLRRALYELITLRADLAAQVIPALGDAQLVLVPSGRVQSLEPWEEMRDAYRYALTAQPPMPLLYLDMVDRQGGGLLDGGPLGSVLMTGALVARDEQVLMITAFGGPTDASRLGTGGPFQPLANILYGATDSRPARLSALDVFIDCQQDKIMLASELRDHLLLGTVCGVACAMASRVLRLLEDLGDLRPVPGDPNARAKLRWEGRRIPLGVR